MKFKMADKVSPITYYLTKKVEDSTSMEYNITYPKFQENLNILSLNAHVDKPKIDQQIKRQTEPNKRTKIIAKRIKKLQCTKKKFQSFLLEIGMMKKINQDNDIKFESLSGYDLIEYPNYYQYIIKVSSNIIQNHHPFQYIQKKIQHLIYTFLNEANDKKILFNFVEEEQNINFIDNECNEDNVKDQNVFEGKSSTFQKFDSLENYYEQLTKRRLGNNFKYQLANTDYNCGGSGKLCEALVHILQFYHQFSEENALSKIQKEQLKEILKNCVTKTQLIDFVQEWKNRFEQVPWYLKDDSQIQQFFRQKSTAMVKFQNEQKQKSQKQNQ